MRSDVVTGVAGSGPEGATVFCHTPVEGVSVVMVSYRTGDVLFVAIDAVLARDQEGVAELILIDNGNPPEVVAELVRRAEAEPRFTLVGGRGNIGFAQGCNLGARHARGRHLLLLNPDCRLGPGAVPALRADRQQPGQPAPGGVAQDPRLPALLPRALPHLSPVFPAGTPHRRRRPGPFRDQGGAIASPFRPERTARVA